jgi:hypothetical protein
MVDNKQAWRDINAMVLNAMETRASLIQKMLDPRRDLDNECGYVSDPTALQFNEMYNKEGIARRVVHIWPKECWQNHPLIYETEESRETDFEKAWDELDKDKHLCSVMFDADRISGIGRFGLILLGLDDGVDLSQPVRKGQRKLLYTRVFDESVITISTSETDTANPRYGQPITYDIDFEELSGGTAMLRKQTVHWTRVIHVADNRRMSVVLGESRMRSVFNRLQDVRKLLGGSAEMFWQGAFPGLSFEVDPRLMELGTVELDEAALKQQVSDYVNGLQRYLSTVGVGVNSLAPQVADPSNHVEAQLKAIALSIDVPYRVFMGTEEAKLAASQDSKTWAKRVNQRQNDYLTPFLVRPVLDRLIELGILPKPEKLFISWPDMLTPSDKEKADVAAKRTEAMAKFVQGNVEMLMSAKDYLIEVWGFTPDKAELVLRAARENIEGALEAQKAAEAAEVSTKATQKATQIDKAAQAKAKLKGKPNAQSKTA